MKELRTKRLILRGVVVEDAALLYRGLGCDPAMSTYTGWNPYSTLEAAQQKGENDLVEVEQGKLYSWIITAEGTPVGTIGAYDYDPDSRSIELGYSIFRTKWGKGYASEAATAVVSYLLGDAGLHRITAWCHAGNAASARVLEKAGMKLVRRVPGGMEQYDGTRADRLEYETWCSDIC